MIYGGIYIVFCSVRYNIHFHIFGFCFEWIRFFHRFATHFPSPPLLFLPGAKANIPRQDGQLWCPSALICHSGVLCSGSGGLQ
jgi:hypothetical protein